MKRIYALLLCIVLMCAMPVAVFAEDIDAPTTTEEEMLPTSPENLASWSEAELVTEKIKAYVQSHLEELWVIVTMVIATFLQAKKQGLLGKSVGILNNNSVAVAENSTKAIADSTNAINNAVETVNGYKEEIFKLLDEVRANESEKQAQKALLSRVEKFLETSKAANIEIANEVSELLLLANIPNSKKEELYSRHRAAVDAITTTEVSEVSEDDGEEA